MPTIGLCFDRFSSAFAFAAGILGLVDRTCQGTSFASTVVAASSCRLHWLEPELELTIELHRRFQTSFTSIIATK